MASSAIDQRPVTPNRIRKLADSKTTFEEDLEKYPALIDALGPMIGKRWTMGSGRWKGQTSGGEV